MADSPVTSHTEPAKKHVWRNRLMKAVSAVGLGVVAAYAARSYLHGYDSGQGGYAAKAAVALRQDDPGGVVDIPMGDMMAQARRPAHYTPEVHGGWFEDQRSVLHKILDGLADPFVPRERGPNGEHVKDVEMSYSGLAKLENDRHAVAPWVAGLLVAASSFSGFSLLPSGRGR